ncbi:hypothetical protein CTAM01_05487 [Colletotrichum tamarilloi]|uniref:Uncharacterized protein n=1 Tax=Colletotrichum tamarilloi TaxID=1209934 RepID=A0ABQ9RE85_9PEZI|nr:uncharacterized protein CTAM01_05487 [Colletotrichum tamarilloi]KAK1502049.1 hypothetical protein CTAM01_05487 [Colletotrichum tamarilloi]
MAEGLKPGVRETPKPYIFINGKYWVAKDLTLANFGDLVAAEKPEYDSTTAVQAANRPTVDEPKPQSEGYANFPSLAEMRPPPMMPAGANHTNVILNVPQEPHLLIFSHSLPRHAVLPFEDVHAYHPALALDDFEHQQHAPLAPMAPWHPSNIQEPEVHQNDRALEAVNNCIIAGQQPQDLPGFDDNRFDEHTPHY